MNTGLSATDNTYVRYYNAQHFYRNVKYGIIFLFHTKEAYFELNERLLLYNKIVF